ncbi:MAG: polyprenyl synthetase family protein, partial [Actinomycetes bacterium]
ILTGDFLFARASDLLADLGPEAVRLQARTFERLCTGQIRETVGPPAGADPVEHYLSVLAEKTGSLIATSGRFGALFSGAGPDVAAVLTRYGELIGVAFQLADDLLDVDGDPGVSGKTVGTDLRAGVATLPVLLAHRDGDDPALRALLDGDLRDDHRLADALAGLRSSRAMDTARAELARWADRARDTLSSLPDVPARRALEAACDSVVSRRA